MAADLAGRAFIPYYEHLMDILNTNEELRNTFTGIFQQVALTAAGTAMGAFFGGREGALAGAVAGGAAGYMFSSDYDSMVTVIGNLTDAQKRELVRQVQRLVRDVTIDAFTLYIGTQAGREALIKLLQTFASAVKA